jgi:hypothetical protein
MFLAILILAASLVALAQFFVYYCRALLASSSTKPLSTGRDLPGRGGTGPGADDFDCLLILARLCPSQDAPRRLRAVHIYHSMLRALGALLPAVSDWVLRERRNCTYFAAVELDRQLARNRELFEQRREYGT